MEAIFGTTIDTVAVKLKTLLAAALPDVQVLDGPELTAIRNDTVGIGYTDTQAQPAVLMHRSDPDFDGRVTETVDIICIAAAYSGDTKVALRRGRVVQMIAAVDELLRLNTTMDGVCDNSSLGSDLAVTQLQGRGGSLCVCGFSVHYEAYI